MVAAFLPNHSKQTINMGYIILSDWKTDLEKVSLSKLQINLLNKGLAESKRNVDDLLEGNTVTIEVDDEILASKFINEAQKIGVICHYLPSIKDT
ncbi:hypothetical protein [Bacteroides sp. 51]|uniref:hypothetical protein n=1 Tax=Bacteroides sp. 51 TaxID=2302938 RepID=UPI0013D84734|nr:hypothetical protein [Bacteroides sp. 51]NDV84260.1 hypothetical protein [Bacteroides sp. 51]